MCVGPGRAPACRRSRARPAATAGVAGCRNGGGVGRACRHHHPHTACGAGGGQGTRCQRASHRCRGATRGAWATLAVRFAVAVAACSPDISGRACPQAARRDVAAARADASAARADARAARNAEAAAVASSKKAEASAEEAWEACAEAKQALEQASRDAEAGRAGIAQVRASVQQEFEHQRSRQEVREQGRAARGQQTPFPPRRVPPRCVSRVWFLSLVCDVLHGPPRQDEHAREVARLTSEHTARTRSLELQVANARDAMALVEELQSRLEAAHLALAKERRRRKAAQSKVRRQHPSLPCVCPSPVCAFACVVAPT